MLRFRDWMTGTNADFPGVVGVPDAEYHENKYARALGRSVIPGARWLDLGAGSRVHGGWLPPSPEDLVGTAGFVVGTDMHGAHLRENASLAAAVRSDAQALPFRNEAFDIVSANMVVEHLENPIAVFRELARLLVPGGKFVFSTPNLNNPIVLASAWLLAARWRTQLSHAVERRELEHIFPTHYRCNTESTIVTMAREVGFRVCELDLFSSFPFAKSVPILVQVEGRLIRILKSPRLRGARSNILAILERSA